MNARIDISPDQLKTVKAILRAHLPTGAHCWAFGSRVTWTAKPFSDLDLAVEGNGPLSTEVMADLAEAFEESDLPWRVDVIDLNAVSDEFREIVEARRMPYQIRGCSTMNISEIVDFNPQTRLTKGEPFPFIQMAALPVSDRDIPNYEHRAAGGSGSKFQNGDTLLARITPCLENGKGGLVRDLPGDGLGHGSTEFIVMRAHQKSDENFVYYLSRLPEFRAFAIQQMTGTSGRQRVNWQSLADFEIPELDASLRENAGLTLAALDDKIELNRRMSETLEEMARAIFKDWFVDFGPTRRQMEGATDPTAIMGHTFPPEKAGALAPLFSDRLAADGRPEGWRLGAVSDLIEFNPTESLKKGTITPYIDMASLPTSGSVTEPPILREFGSGMKFRDGDALLARITPCLENGKAAYIQGLGDGVVAWGSTEFIVMRARPPVPAPVSYLLARENDFRGHAIRSMTGTSGRQRAQADMISAYAAALPGTPALWNRLGVSIEPLFDRIAANAHESRTLTALRDLLLPKLISGEICVRDAEKHVREAT